MTSPCEVGSYTSHQNVSSRRKGILHFAHCCISSISTVFDTYWYSLNICQLQEWMNEWMIINFIKIKLRFRLITKWWVQSQKANAIRTQEKSWKSTQKYNFPENTVSSISHEKMHIKNRDILWLRSILVNVSCAVENNLCFSVVEIVFCK